jgi:hypothetical protein
MHMYTILYYIIYIYYICVFILYICHNIR